MLAKQINSKSSLFLPSSRLTTPSIYACPIHILIELCKVTHPASTGLVSVEQEFMRQKLLDTPSLLSVFDEALLNKVSEISTPFLRNTLNRVINHRIEQFLHVLCPVVERWVALGELKCKATECPNVYLSRVGVALGNLWRDPAWSPLLRLSILLLLSQENAETHVSNFDITVGTAKDVV